MLCYVNEQMEFHTLINSVTEEELNGNSSLWWLMNDLHNYRRIEAVNVVVLSLKKRGELQGRKADCM